MALTGHLDIKVDRRPAREGETDYEAYLAYMHQFGGCQRDIEVALATILLTEGEYRAERQGRVRRSRRGA